MLKIVILFLTIFSCFLSGAQVLTGTVYDETTKKPIPGVVVYLDGTMISTYTDTLGKYKLVPKEKINTKLVFHHVVYDDLVEPDPFGTPSGIYYMKEKINILDEIKIIAEAEGYSHAQKMRAFRDQFLGLTKAGSSCQIINEDDITLTYDSKTQKLSASSETPLIIINNYLNYKIMFTLKGFWIQYNSSKMATANIEKSFYAGYSSFTDLSPEDKKIKRRRRDIYDNSPNYFFKKIATKSLSNTNFKLYNKNFTLTNQSLHFHVKDTLSQTMIKIKPDSNMDVFKTEGFTINVMYNERVVSEITFFTDSILVDSYGNINTIDKVLYRGYMGQMRVGDMLPLNYEIESVFR